MMNPTCFDYETCMISLMSAERSGVTDWKNIVIRIASSNPTIVNEVLDENNHVIAYAKTLALSSKISAIKHLRAHFNMSLKDANAMVTSWGIFSSTPTTPTTPTI